MVSLQPIMQVRIKILDLPELAAIFGRRDFLFSFPGEHLEDLLQSLVEQYGPALKPLLLDSRGQWNQTVRVIVRGQLCAGEIATVPLTEGDQLAFVAFLEGG